MRYPPRHYWLVACQPRCAMLRSEIVHGTMEAHARVRKRILAYSPELRSDYNFGVYTDYKHPKGVRVAMVDLGPKKPRLDDETIRLLGLSLLEGPLS